jgi:hypothetical protein
MTRRYSKTSRRRLARAAAVVALIALATALVAAKAPSSRTASPAAIPAPRTAIHATESSVIDFAETALRTQGTTETPPVRVLDLERNELEAPPEPAASEGSSLLLAPPATPSGVQQIAVASPAPSQDYMGLDDVPMADSSFIVIPPDVAGGVGPTKVMESFNNNYRIRDKATGVTQLTMGTATFWAAVTLPSERLSLTDPRTTYDPYNNRWIVCMQTVGLSGSVLVGVSQTSDPAGAWNLYKFTGLSGSLGTAYQLDFPIIGFNKNWVTVTINRYTSGGVFSYGICLALDYPQLRGGVGTGSLFTLNTGGASTHFCTAPAVTYSATEDSLFLVTHLSSGGATFAVDVITGTSGAPVYNLAAASNVRPGGGWTQPSGNLEPQSAPNAGASACGATPCKIEAQDAQVRSSPIYRNGFVWYAQTIGLPAGTLTRTSAQWTKITPSTTPAFADGGRLDDPTATATNGGKWYDHVSLSVNAKNDMMLGFTQFSSAQHPGSGYAFRFGTDAAGTLRDPLVYHAGEDYYHKTFSTATGRNRWGDFSTVQVDPCDDLTLWALQEYAKTRTGTDDGNTGSNSSKWSSWWAAVAGPPRLAGLFCPADTIGTPGGTVTRKFRIVNNGGTSDQFDYTITDAAGWGGPVNGTTPVLAPASFFDVFVNFNISPVCSPTSDLVTLTATPVAPTCALPVSCTSRIFCDFATATLVSRIQAQPASGGVDVTWSSDAVGQVKEWNVYRSSSDAVVWTRVNPSPIAMGGGGEFRFHDDPAGQTGDLTYRLDGRMADGTVATLGTAKVAVGPKAVSFAVTGANPFQSSTTLRYALPTAQPVRIELYSVAGQRLRTLVDGTQPAGEHLLELRLGKGRDALAPGVYLVRLSSASYQRTLRVVGIE